MSKCKRSISALLAVLVFAVVISSAAVSAATPDEAPAALYYSIYADGDGFVTASADRVEAGSGEAVTLTAEDSDFLYWEIRGAYQIVSGDLDDSRVLVIIPQSDIDAYGVFEMYDNAGDDIDDDIDGGNLPEAPPVFVINVSALGGAAETSAGSVPSYGNAVVTLTATGSGKFIGWDITGSFEILSGSLIDKVITIQPDSNIRAVAVFEKIADNPSTADQADSNPGNSSSTSPKTGHPVAAFAGLVLLAAAAAPLAVKKIRE